MKKEEEGKEEYMVMQLQLQNLNVNGCMEKERKEIKSNRNVVRVRKRICGMWKKFSDDSCYQKTTVVVNIRCLCLIWVALAGHYCPSLGSLMDKVVIPLSYICRDFWYVIERLESLIVQ